MALPVESASSAPTAAGVANPLRRNVDQGGFVVRPDGTFGVDPAKVKAAVTSLTREIMTIKAEGDYAKAIALRDRMGVIRPPVQKALDRLTTVPVDIEPQFTTAQQLLTPAR